MSMELVSSIMKIEYSVIMSEGNSIMMHAAAKPTGRPRGGSVAKNFRSGENSAF